MGFVYVEFQDERPALRFASIASHVSRPRGATLALDLDRTWRLGECAERVSVLTVEEGGLERLAEWSTGAEPGEVVSRRLAHVFVNAVDRAGCYDALLPVVPASGGGWFFLELLREHPEQTGADVARYFAERSERLSGCRVHALLRRIGGLGPEPSILAVWGLSAPEAINTVARDLDGVTRPVSLAGCGVYTAAGSKRA
ncbi:MAG: hypothetical protein OEV29_12910 [Thermoleophilia bacterium]|nr:hypothetical protein [Thermoleophilia bacterium]